MHLCLSSCYCEHFKPCRPRVILLQKSADPNEMTHNESSHQDLSSVAQLDACPTGDHEVAGCKKVQIQMR